MAECAQARRRGLGTGPFWPPSWTPCPFLGLLCATQSTSPKPAGRPAGAGKGSLQDFLEQAGELEGGS